MMSDPSTTSGPTIPVIPDTHTILIPPPPPPPSPSPPPPPPPSPPPPSKRKPKKPRLDLLQGTSREVGNKLNEAALKGDWKAAKPILVEQGDLVRYAITEKHETLLHVAASARSTKGVEEFVKNLVDFMQKDDLEIVNVNGDTALMSAARAGNVEMAKTMVEKNEGLSDIPNKQELMPLYIAALLARSEMVRYLYDKSSNMSGVYWTHRNRCWVLENCVEAKIFDVVIKIVNARPELTKDRSMLINILLALAKSNKAFEGEKTNFVSRIFNTSRPSVEVSEGQQLLRTIWGKIAKLGKEEIDTILRGNLVEENIEGKTVTTYPTQLLFAAVKFGNTRFITEIIGLYPDAAMKEDDKGKTIFHLAIKHRKVEIYKLLHETGEMKDLITPIRDHKGNSMLHMVAKSAKHQQFQNVAEAALHIQSGLLWFKEVENMIPEMYRKRKNNEKETPKDLFNKTHALLITKCEKWMKSYMLVATLLATIVFAAAFTLPGGYSQTTGIPYFRNKPSLIIFVIADAISLLSATTSVLMFLSMLTSNYNEIEALKSLPGKLSFAVATLFFSITTMMIAFSASFFVLYTGKLKPVPITITCLAGVQTILFTTMQLPSLIKVFYLAYKSGDLFKPGKRIL